MRNAATTGAFLLLMIAVFFTGTPAIVYVLAIIGLALWWFWQ